MAKLNLEAVLSLIDKVSEPLKDITQSSDKVSKALKEQKEEMKKLNQSMGNITSFKRMHEVLKQTSSELEQAKAKAQQLGQQLAQTANPTKAMIKEFEQARKAVRYLEQAQQSQTLKLQGYRKVLNEAGINTKNFVGAEIDLRKKIEQGNAVLEQRKKKLEQVKQAQERYKKTQETIATLREKSGNFALQATAGTASMIVPVKMAMDFESSMADVKKVVDFDTPQQFKQMEQDIIGLSKRLPMTANDIAKIISAGGQSGIAKNELLSFGESAIKMGVAFDITADEAGQAMAEMRTAFKMTQPEVVALADKINWLGNNSPNEAKKVMEVVQRIGSLGEVGGFASSSIAAMAASLTAVQPDVAATGIKNMILALTKGESATKSQKAAFKELGLDHKKIAKDMQVDANATVAQVMTAIGKLDKDKRVAITNDIFGSEALPIVAQYAENLGTLQKNLQAVSDKSKYAGSMEAEYASRAATTANNLQLMKNKMSAVAMTAGATLLPLVNQVMDKIGAVADKVHAWSVANPELASTLMKIAVVMVAVLGALSAGALAITAFIGPLALLKVSLASIGMGGIGTGAVAMVSRLSGALLFLSKKAIPLAVLGLRALAIATLTNPLTVIIALIAVVALAIHRYWQPIKAFFKGFWDGLKLGLAPMVDSVSIAFNQLKIALEPLRPIWDSLVSIWNIFKGVLLEMLSPMQANNEQLQTATNLGHLFGMMLGSLIGIVVETFMTIGRWLGETAAKIALFVASAGTHFNNFKAFLSSVGASVYNGLVAPINGAISAVNSLIAQLNRIPKVSIPSIPSVPTMAQPTSLQATPKVTAVAPLKANVNRSSVNHFAGANINISGVSDPNMVASIVDRQLQQHQLKLAAQQRRSYGDYA
ncbi:phage tail tape measure protein [Moraxella sp. ZY210820]|uniref:phage tail tape measure protein n=1 Tax=unclassified Moraxella TaxID=2685852 RepID=UPI002730259B|nr:phage tail tape measure protein [Moraxella sp. ZY210820]WLF84489.1 phage tail tape measure protein [Moraxella sp. ZY210820]